MNKSAKIRIYPNKQQQEQLAVEFGHARFVYNKALEKAKNEKWNFKQASSDLTRLKKEIIWLGQASATALVQSLRNLDSAFKNFFGKRAKYPKFKSRYSTQSVRYQDVDLGDDWVKIPKCGVIKAKITRDVFKPKMITISKTITGKYFASFNYECDYEPMVVPEGMAIGIDMGLTNHTADSNGNIHKSPKWHKQKQTRLARYQRMMARRKKGSNRRNKARHLVARTWEKINNAKSDYLHKLSHRIVRDNQIIAVENLDVSQMMKNKRYSKNIWDSSWFEFRRMLKYKSDWNKRIFVEVDPAFTSRTCHTCSYIDEKNRSGERFVCLSCGHRDHADVNAGKNILRRGLEQIARGTGKLKLALPDFRKNSTAEISENFARLCFS